MTSAYEKNLISDILFNRDINSGLSKDTFNSLNDQYLEERYNQLRNNDLLKNVRQKFSSYLDPIFIHEYIEQIAINIKSDLEVGSFVNMYLTAIEEKEKSCNWQDFVNSSKGLQMHI